MAVRIRLQRRGKKKNPVYRVVVQDSRVARDGKVIEIIGQYNPVVTPTMVKIDADQAKNWLSKGALPTKTVERLLIKEGVLPKKEEKKSTKKAAKAELTEEKAVKEETKLEEKTTDDSKKAEVKADKEPKKEKKTEEKATDNSKKTEAKEEKA